MSTQITTRDIKPIEKRLASFGLSKQIVERETSFALSLINSSNTLSQCTKESICKSIITAANIGFTLNPEAKECALIARKNRKTGLYECSLMPMYQGIANLAFKAGNVAQLDTVEVRENDQCEFNHGLPMPVKHSYGFGDRGKPIGYYTLVRYEDGGRQVEPMEMKEVLKARNESDSYQYAVKDGKEKNHPWYKWFSEMARKACLKRALKYVNTSNTDKLNKAIDLDNQDYGAAEWQKRKVAWLVESSTLDDEQKAEIERGIKWMSSTEADETILQLEMNQKPNHPGWNDQVGKRVTGKQVQAQVENAKA